jgi:hypothetical protein
VSWNANRFSTASYVDAHTTEPPTVPVSSVGVRVTPVALAALADVPPSDHSASGTAAARCASSTQPVTCGWSVSSAYSSRSTTQRSGSGGSPSLLPPVWFAVLSWPRSSASGIAQCRCTPGARGVPSSNGAGIESAGSAPSGVASCIGSRTIGSLLLSGPPSGT